MDTNELISAQIAYYRARASQYDGELEQVAGYDSRSDFLERWEADVAEIDAWLAEDPPTGHALEIAAGSGNRTGSLLRTADRVTAVDASPEMLELLSAKHPSVELIEADIFTWEPPQRYDSVFFGFWISHVPSARWKTFWQIVDRALKPSGKVWFCDNAHPQYANSRGPGDWPEASGLRHVETGDPEVAVRTLHDGSQWHMVKRFWWPAELESELGKLGWQVTAGHTDFAFIYGTAERL